MKSTIFRAIVTMMFAMVVLLPAGVGAQDGTPAATPAETLSAQGGDLEAATTWLIDQQLEDGAFPGFSGEADAGTTVDAVIALVAAQSRGVDVGTGHNVPLTRSPGSVIGSSGAARASLTICGMRSGSTPTIRRAPLNRFCQNDESRVATSTSRPLRGA